MKLSDVLAALSGLDNGTELKTFLQTLVSQKDTAISEAEAKLSAVEARVKAIAASVGGDEIEDKLKELKTTAAKLTSMQSEVDTYKTEAENLKTQVSQLDRKDKMTTFAQVVGADREVLMELLPQELEFATERIDDNGKSIDRGYVVIDKKKLTFSDYVKQDAKLSKFAASIFPNTTQPTPSNIKLPSGKNSDTPAPSSTEALKTYMGTFRKGIVDRVAEKYKV